MSGIDTGDHVYVRTVREEWLVAYCRDGHVVCCGWPETRVPAEHCELLRKATDRERSDLLQRLAAMQSDGYDSRREYARQRLAEETLP